MLQVGSSGSTLHLWGDGLNWSDLIAHQYSTKSLDLIASHNSGSRELLLSQRQPWLLLKSITSSTIQLSTIPSLPTAVRSRLPVKIMSSYIRALARVFTSKTNSEVMTRLSLVSTLLQTRAR